jgi:hypothetical protein
MFYLCPPKSLSEMEFKTYVEIWNEAAQFHFWENLFRILITVSLHCIKAWRNRHCYIFITLNRKYKDAMSCTVSSILFALCLLSN